MYKIIGADRKEYGPATSDQMHAWIAEHRINAQTQVRAEADPDWKPLSAFPEFADALGLAGAPPTPPETDPDGPLIEQILTRDYSLSIGDCISGGLDLLKANAGLLIGGVLIYAVIVGCISLLSAIPFVGPLFSLANIVVAPPLLGGLYYIFLRAIRRQPATSGDVFIGYRTAFAHLILGKMVPGLIAALCLIPVGIAAAIAILVPIFRHDQPSTAGIAVVVMIGLVCAIPMLFLLNNWLFTLPLIIDRRMSFWPAMQASWKMVTRHWWRVFGLMFCVGLLNLVGAAFCLVGLIFTVPIGVGALMHAYEIIFGSRRTLAP